MARGKKLDIFIGANMEDSYAKLQSPRKSEIFGEILEPSKHFLIFKKEKRRGKTVTLVGEFKIPKEDASTTLKLLKKKIGCGGTYKDGWMEFQGELKDKLRIFLIDEGFRFKHNH